MTLPFVTLTLPLVSIVLVILHSSTELCATKKRKTTTRYSVVLHLTKILFIEIDTHIGFSNKLLDIKAELMHLHVYTCMRMYLNGKKSLDIFLGTLTITV